MPTQSQSFVHPYVHGPGCGCAFCTTFSAAQLSIIDSHAQAIAASMIAADLANFQQTSGTGAIDFKSLGGVPDGVTDNSAKLTAALLFVAGSGLGLYFSPGTWKFLSPVVWPSNTTIVGSPGATILNGMAAGAPAPGNNVLVAVGATVNAAGTVNTTPAFGATSLSVASATKPTVGNYIQVSHNTSVAVYQVKSAAGGVSPWTIGLDRPIAFPWVATDTVQEYSSVPHDLTLYNNNMAWTGAGDGFIELTQAYRVRIFDFVATPGTGIAAQNQGIGVDIGCRDVVIDRGVIDATGSAGGYNGIYFQSNERSICRNFRVKNAATIGIAIIDCYSTGVEGCWALGGSRGITVSSFAANCLGSFDCWIRGGGAIASAISAYVGEFKAIRTKVQGFDGSGATSTAALLTGVNSISTVWEGCSGHDSVTGFYVAAGATNTHAKHIDTSNCSGVSLANAAYLALDGWTASGGTFAIGNLATLGSVCHLKNAIVDFTGCAQGIQFTGNRAVVSCALGTGSDIFLYVTAGVLIVDDVQNNSVRGCVISAGCTGRFGPRCNFDSSTGAPLTIVGGGFSNKATFNLTGNVNLDVAWPDLRSTDHVLLAMSLPNTQGLLPRIVSYTIGTGFRVVGSVNDTSTYEYTVL